MTNYYDSIASGYNQLYKEEQLIKLYAAKQILTDHQINIQKKTILDVGCGSGISSDFFVDEYNATVTGIDPSQELLKQSTNKAKLEYGFAENLPYQNNQFDFIVSFSAIQNFFDVQKAFSEMKRVGKSYFLLSVMSRGNSFFAIKALIKQEFTILDEKKIKNDVLFLCRAPNI